MTSPKVLFDYFFFQEKVVSKENFVMSLRQPSLCWHSQPLFYPIPLETSILFSHKILVMASPEVLFDYFFFQEKVGEQKNFVKPLRQPSLCWHSQPLFYQIFLEVSILFSRKISVMASPEVLFDYFFFQEKVGEQKKLCKTSEATIPLLALSATFLPNILGSLNSVLSQNLSDGFT